MKKKKFAEIFSEAILELVVSAVFFGIGMLIFSILGVESNDFELTVLVGIVAFALIISAILLCFKIIKSRSKSASIASSSQAHEDFQKEFSMNSSTAKTGLVLEGGGMKGLYTAGILDVFMKNGLHFDGVIGVSAGAIHACSMLSEQKGRSIRYYKKYCSDPRFMGIKSLLRTGNIVGVDFCYNEIPNVLDPYDYDTFLKNCEGTEFYVTCTNLESGKPEYKKISDMRTQMDYMRASASLPFVSKIVSIDGSKYLDGGCSDSIPIEAFRSMGYKRNVVILTRPATHVRKKEYGILAKVIYRKYPDFVKTLLEHHNTYNDTVRHLAELEEADEVFIIRPDHELNIGKLESNSDKLTAIYELGVSDGEKYIKELKAWLSAKEDT